MTSIVFHGAPGPGGRPGGKPRTGRMSSRDPVVAARLVRSVVQKGEWRTLPGRDDKTRILLAISSTARWALLSLTPDVVDVLPAVGKALPLGGCHWCSAAVQRSPEPELDHRDPVNLALLGNPCSSCQQRWRKAAASAAVAKREGEDLAQVGAGVPVPAAAAGLERARRLFAAAGTIRAAGRGKQADPPYYQRRRP